MNETTEHLGTYGLRLPGQEALANLISRLTGDEPELRIRQVCPPDHEAAANGRWDYVADLLGGGQLRMARGSAVAEYHVDRLLGPAELLHPFLAPAAAQACHWAGRTVLHAGVVARDGVALAVVGDREAGKSTLMAALAVSGRFDVMSDDLAVVEAGRVHAGPRCVDLREGAAQRFAEEDTVLVRDGSRQRLLLPPCPKTARLAGVVALQWASDVGFAEVPAVQRLPVLHPHAAVHVSAEPLRRLFGIAALPMWWLRRPRDWDRLAETADIIEGLLIRARG